MKHMNLDELTKAYPAVDRNKLADALAILEKVARAGVQIGRPFRSTLGRSSLVPPDPKQDPRAIKLRTRP